MTKNPRNIVDITQKQIVKLLQFCLKLREVTMEIGSLNQSTGYPPDIEKPEGIETYTFLYFYTEKHLHYE